MASQGRKRRKQNKEREMASNVNENAFAYPWNGSDMVLVVEGQEMNVHKTILTMQSPVFKAMFDGHFQEASQSKITLKQKDSQSMKQFVKFLYPSSMFPECKIPLDDKDRSSVMALADEYQCENLMKQFIDEAKITTKNVLNILPYAVKYHHTALVRVFNVIKSGIPTSKLESFLPEMSKDTSDTILLAKCHYLEMHITKMQDAIMPLLRDLLIQKKFSNDVKRALDDALMQITILEEVKDLDELKEHPWCNGPYNFDYSRVQKASRMETTAGSRCRHKVEVGEIWKIKHCITCKRKYRRTFITQIPSCQNEQQFLKLLQKGDVIANAVDPQRTITTSDNT